MMMLACLLAAADDDRREKFAALYQSYRYTMLYVARSVLKNQAEAEDTVHDAFLKIYEILDQIEEINCNKTKSLVVIIVKNKAIDRLRRAKRTDQQPLEDYEALLTDSAGSLEDVVADRQGYDQLVSAIQSLGDRYRSVLELKYLHGYSNSEVSRILEIEPNTLNMRLYRAKAKLRELLEKEEKHGKSRRQ